MFCNGLGGGVSLLLQSIGPATKAEFLPYI
jgi:hypothetical protein